MKNIYVSWCNICLQKVNQKMSRVINRVHALLWGNLKFRLKSFLQQKMLKFLSSGQINYAFRIVKNDWTGILKSQNMSKRIVAMATILEKGWPVPTKVISSEKVYNGKVLFALHNSLPYDHAGYAVRSHTILKELRCHDVDVVACTRLGYPWDLIKHQSVSKDIEQVVDGVIYRRLVDNVVKLGAPEDEYVISYGDALAKEAQARGCRVVHAASNYLNGLAASYAASCIGGRSVYECRGLWHLTRLVREPWLQGSELMEFFHKSELAAAQQADAVVAISESLKFKLIEDGISEGKITVVPNAVDVTLFLPKEVDLHLRASLGLKNNKVVCFIGSLTEYEGLELIMEAVARLNNAGEKVVFVIVGDGPHAKALHSLCKKMGNPSFIIFVGRVPFADVGKYYSLADVLPFPRRDFAVCRYVPPLKILEAMCMGKNVIVSALSPLQEMVVHNETGLVCKPDDINSLSDSISNIINNPFNAERLRNNARDWILQNRDWKVVSRKYLDLYNNI